MQHLVGGHLFYFIFILFLFRFITGFPATLEIKENLENEFPILQSGKTRGIRGNPQKS